MTYEEMRPEDVSGSVDNFELWLELCKKEKEREENEDKKRKKTSKKERN